MPSKKPIQFYVTDAEKIAIRQKAAAAGLDVAAYCRNRALQKSAVLPERQRWLAYAGAALTYLRETPPDIAAAKERLETLGRDALQRISARRRA